MSNVQKDLEYIFSTEVGKVIAEGLTILYENQPSQPIDYLSQWLFNYSAEQRAKTLSKEAEQHAIDLRHKLEERFKAEAKEKQFADYEKNQLIKLENLFKEQVKNHQFHEDLLPTEVPAFLQQRLGLPAVYIGFVDYPIKKINLEDEDEPTAHLNTEEQRLITYIGASPNQKFMIGKQLKPETGITWDVFKAPEPPENLDPEVPYVEETPYNKYCPDVTQEKNIVYFEIPRLGSWMGVSLAYKSVLNDIAFEEGVKERLKIAEEKEKLEKEKEEAESEYRQKVEEAEEQGQDTQPIHDEWNNREWPKVEEKEFEFVQREFVLCVDTLGQDRELTEEERKFLKEFGGFFVECWEKSEKEQLSRDIDAQIEMTKDYNKEEFVETMVNRAEDLLTSGMATEEQDDGESEIKANFKKAFYQAEAFKQLLLEEEHMKWINILKLYRNIKNWNVIQEAMILAGYKKEEINLPGTNVLNWRIIKEKITREDFYDKVAEFPIKGPKTEKPPKYAYINRIAKRLEKIVVDDLDNYNAGLGILFRYLKAVCEARILDIQVRKEQKNRERQRRQQLIEEENQRQVQRETELNEARERFNADEDNQGQEFNADDWLKEWENDNPPIEIPEEVVDDIDLDLEVEGSE